MVTFEPGEWIGVASSGVVAMLPSQAGEDFVLGLWDLLKANPGPEGLLEYLVSDGFSGLPSLAVVAEDEGDDGLTRLVVRGNLCVDLALLDGSTETIEAKEAITWVERSVRAASSARLRAMDSESVGPPKARLYCLSEGIVPVSEMCVGGGVDQQGDQDDVHVQSADAFGVREMAYAPGGAQEDPPAAPVVLESEAEGDVELAGSWLESDAADQSQDPDALDRMTRSASDVGLPISDSDVTRRDVEQPATDAPGADDGLGHLFEATSHRPVSEAGLGDPDDSSAGSGVISSVPGGGRNPDGSSAEGSDGKTGIDDPLGDQLGDHDAMTIARMPSRSGGEGEMGSASPAMADHMVHAVECPSGHPNPPSASTCRVCGAGVEPQEHISIPRPPLGVLRFTDGSVRELTRNLLLGRSPQVKGSSAEEMPELVSLQSPEKEVSGTHLEVRVEGWQVLVVDRRSTNGTTVQLPGREPQRLQPSVPVPIVPGTVVDLAQEVQFTFEVPS